MRTEPGVVRKIAECEQDRKKLACEAAVLAGAAHPGVVRLVRVVGGHPPCELVFEEVKGHPLAHIGKPLDWSEVAGLGAAVATTLADLHDIGVAHHAISGEHVLLDEDGRPVLCGFGGATRFDDVSAARAAAAADTASLAALLAQLGDGLPPRPVTRILRSFRNRAHLARGRSCRALARALVEGVPDARLPGAPSAREGTVGGAVERLRDRRKHHRAGVALANGLGAVGFVVVALFGMRVIGAEVRNPGKAAGCPRVDAGCSVRAVSPGAVISSAAGRFRLIGIEGVVAVGRWRCDGVGSPAVLDILNGDVWVFDGWPMRPPGEEARLVARIPAASGLRVLPGSGHASGCDALLVKRRGLPPAELHFSQFSRT